MDTKLLLKQLQEAAETVVQSGRFDELVRLQARFMNYSFGNMLLVFWQMPDAQMLRTYQGWLRLGRHVKKGEHAIYILEPLPYVKKDSDGQEVHRIWFRSAARFDISQTEGEPVKDVIYLDGQDPENVLERVINLASASGLTVETGKDLGLAAGETSSGKIALSYGNSPLANAATVVHELAHQYMGHLGSHKPRALCEVEAESVSYIVNTAMGYDVEQFSASYLAGWTGGKNETLVEAMKASGNLIRETASRILSEIGVKENDEA